MRKQVSNSLLAVATVLLALVPNVARADSVLGPMQLVEVAMEVNPQVRAARARWYSAIHSIRQNYAPADPIFGYANIDSPTNGFSEASVHTLTVTESLQFPGKALLQADKANRNADIARLTYQSVVRDVRAQTETAYYQILLDSALAGVQGETVADLQQVLKITQVAYSANQVTQTDFISSEFDLTAAQQNERQLRTAELNDETTLNQLLFRPPGEPLELDRKLELKPLEIPLDKLVDLAARVRQEILEAALAERNSETALELAKLEYAPDYTIGYTFDNYLLASGAPSPNRLQDHGLSINFNIPLFFWLKQEEDVKRANFDLEAARDDANSIRSQTTAGVTNLYRTAQLAYQTATLYRDSLIPLARQDFQVAVVAYESGKIDFIALASTLRRSYDSRVAYLQAANQFLASRVALEQAIGEPLTQ
jgi:cobalt-zinc-cadmium efflux system outer membrane protein